MQTRLSAIFPLLSPENQLFSSSWYGKGKGDHLYKGILGRQGEVESFSCIGVSQLPSVQYDLYANVAHFGVAYSDTLQMYHSVNPNSYTWIYYSLHKHNTLSRISKYLPWFNYSLCSRYCARICKHTKINKNIHSCPDWYGSVGWSIFLYTKR